jgi:hypothetical protein
MRLRTIATTSIENGKNPCVASPALQLLLSLFPLSILCMNLQKAFFRET